MAVSRGGRDEMIQRQIERHGDREGNAAAQAGANAEGAKRRLPFAIRAGIARAVIEKFEVERLFGAGVETAPNQGGNAIWHGAEHQGVILIAVGAFIIIVANVIRRRPVAVEINAQARVQLDLVAQKSVPIAIDHGDAITAVEGDPIALSRRRAANQVVAGIVEVDAAAAVSYRGMTLGVAANFVALNPVASAPVR